MRAQRCVGEGHRTSDPWSRVGVVTHPEHRRTAPRAIARDPPFGTIGTSALAARPVADGLACTPETHDRAWVSSACCGSPTHSPAHRPTPIAASADPADSLEAHAGSGHAGTL